MANPFVCLFKTSLPMYTLLLPLYQKKKLLQIRTIDKVFNLVQYACERFVRDLSFVMLINCILDIFSFGIQVQIANATLVLCTHSNRTKNTKIY
ncbi:hypothetical protein AGMMS49531_00330 [Endomicrobiia bacterium]|nr:hypothetical protein AGMMS49531_00330 [Endomicrobiia bacterium]